MVASGYDVHLYCENNDTYSDAPGRIYWDHPYGRGEQQFFGETWQQCARSARSAGWIISPNRQHAFCPLCTFVDKQGRRRRITSAPGGV